MTVGFVGTGTIASAIVTGLNSQGVTRHDIRLSPRNREVAASLADAFANVFVCASNQEVLNSSGIVVLSVRPQVADDVLSNLNFVRGQTVISLVPGFSVARIADLIGPAIPISRAIPLPAVARRRGPIAIYPPGSAAAELFAGLGHVFEIETEDYVASMFASLRVTGIETSPQSFADLAVTHATPGGLNEQVLRDLVHRGVFHSLAQALDSVHRRATGEWA